MGVMASIAVVASIASAGMAAYSAHEAGKGTQAADEYQADRADQAALFGRVKAAETDAQARENLNITMGNLDAVRATSGGDPSSPTTVALRDRTMVLGDRARTIQVSNINSQVTQDVNDASYFRQAGSFAMYMGDVNAATTFAGGIAKSATSLAAGGAGGGGGYSQPADNSAGDFAG